MAPRRAVRVTRASRQSTPVQNSPPDAPVEANTASGTAIGIETTRLRGAGVLGSPSAFSTTYGSQAPRSTPKRTINRPSSLSAAINSVVETIENDDQVLAEVNDQRNEKEVARTGVTQRNHRARSREAAKAKTPSPPPSRPRTRGNEDPDPVDLIPTGETKQRRPRAAVPSVPSTGRSFVEESSIFNGADLDTPASPRGSRRSASAEETPIPSRAPRAQTEPPAEPKAAAPLFPLAPELVLPPFRPAEQQQQPRKRSVHAPAAVQEQEAIPTVWKTAGASLNVASKGAGFLAIAYVLIRIVAMWGNQAVDFNSFPLYENRPSWHGFGYEGMKSNIIQFVPSAVLHPLGAISDAQFNDFQSAMRARVESEKLTHAAVKQMQAIIPAIVHVELKNGKPLISQGFWHVIQQHIIQDKEIKDSQADYMMKNWAKANKKKIQDLLASQGIALKVDQIPNNRLVDLLTPAVTQSINENPGAITQKILTSDQFIEQVQIEYAKRKKEFSTELTNEIQSMRQNIIQEVKSTLSGDSDTFGITKDIVEMIDRRVNKAVAKLQLHKLSKTSVKRYYKEHLKHKINWFSEHANPIVSPDLTSPTFSFTKKRSWTPEWLKSRSSPGEHAANTVFKKWDDAGDCWCGTMPVEFDKNGTPLKNPDGTPRRKPAQIQVELGADLIPEHITIEHIAPTATRDPGAMPRKIEVWARVSEYYASQAMQANTLSQFSDPDHDLINRGYALLDRFEYQNTALELEDEAGNTFVRRLATADLLLAKKASTDSVIVRATSTAGDVDHACFYRISLFREEQPEAR